MTKPIISFTKIYSDQDMVELEISVSDGNSLFSNKVYVGHKQFADAIKDLEEFKSNIQGGLYDIKFGASGPEYAGGSFQARLHFHDQGKLYISSFQQSGYIEFPKNKVASECKLYMRSEPALLDNFIVELKAVSAGTGEEANLICR